MVYQQSRDTITLENTVHKPQGLNLCHLGNINPQASTNQAKGFEPLPPVVPPITRNPQSTRVCPQ